MRPPLYVRQLQEDLDRWVAKGLIAADQRGAILDDIEADRGRPTTDWLVLLGAILIGAGAISFVAANWDGIPRGARLALLGTALILSYAIAWGFLRAGRERIGQAFVLLGVAMFGASIMLLGQTYHFNADYPGGIMLWGIGGLAAAALVPSRTALGFAMILGLTWTYVESVDFTPGVHWAYILYWLAALALVYALRWWAGFHLAVLSAIFWIAVSAEGLEELVGLPAVPISYAMLALATLLFGLIREARPARIAVTYGAVLFAALMAISYADMLGSVGQTVDRPEGFFGLTALPVGFWIICALAGVAVTVTWLRGRLRTIEAVLAYAIVGLAAGAPVLFPAVGGLIYVAEFWLGVIWLLALGVARQNRALVNIAMLAFGAGVLITYFQLFQSLFQTALVFVVGGVLFILLSFAIAWANRRWTRTAADGSAEGGAS